MGWNSTEQNDGSNDKNKRVSIPNGMEFYRKELEWNVGIRVSIPNGMEFYIIHFTSFLAANLFQFPTGWNSTKALRAALVFWGRVSIPDGMEFYYRLVMLSPLISQVSIPNGMEFYKTKVTHT